MQFFKKNLRDILFFSCLAIAVFLCSFTGALYILSRSSDAQSPSQYTAQPAQQDTYTVKTYQDKLGVFVNDADTPETVLDIHVALLRKEDQALFEKGVTLHTQEELAQLIEDFSS